ncbi:MAG: excisionase [Pseudomonadota bacterium]|nr:excisionase [Pseudomonadota bacterium]
MIGWVTVKKLVELSGYTENAIRAKTKKGVWLKDKHWRKAPDGRIVFNLKEIQAWMES